MKCRRYRTYLNRKANEERLRAPFDELRLALPSAYREHLDECVRCRRFTAALQQTEQPEALRVSAPAQLASRAALAARRPQEPKRAPSEPAGRWAVPRWAQLAAAALVLIAVTAGVTMKLTGGAGGDTIVVHLHLKAPDAQKVSVVGDWNDWEPQANPLRDENGDGIWETKVRIPKEGEYQYQFLINGERWVPDPNAPIQVEDGFGGTNSVLDI